MVTFQSDKFLCVVSYRVTTFFYFVTAGLIIVTCYIKYMCYVFWHKRVCLNPKSSTEIEGSSYKADSYPKIIRKMKHCLPICLIQSFYALLHSQFEVQFKDNVLEV